MSESLVVAAAYSIADAKKKNKKIGHRRVTGEGTVTYKKKPTTEIQDAIQLGISISIGVVEQADLRDILLRDFGKIETVQFPKEGSRTTPAHHLSDFKMQTFAPVAFRHFRRTFKVDMLEFLNSLCHQELKELSNPGASGSIFYISKDDEFIIKTVQHKEARFLQKLLPEYYINLIQHPRTLMPKFYGLYCYQTMGKNIRFIIMNNLLPSSVKMHEKYDLKGSTFHRSASSKEKSKSCPTLKDLDFREKHPNGVCLDPDTHDALMSTIQRDCRVLESFRIMDYSFLLGIHNIDENLRRKEAQQKGTQRSPNHQTSQLPCNTSDVSDSRFGQRRVSRSKSIKRIAAYSTPLESIQADNPDAEGYEDVSSSDFSVPGIPARSENGDRLYLYIGIIDILQSYRLSKKLEHAIKAAVYDGSTVSVTHPSFYAQRFLEFLGEFVFRKSSTSVKHFQTKNKYDSAGSEEVLKSPINLRPKSDQTLTSKMTIV